MVTIAKLDDKKRLVKYIRKEKAEQGEVVVPNDCDLPTDGTFIYRDGAFNPAGHGHPKPTSPPISTDYVLYLMIDQYVRMGDAVPTECEAWHTWYKENLAGRNKEKLERGKT